MHLCPNTDHDGYEEPATRMIVVDDSTEPLFRCAYCAEGFVAYMLTHGHAVTITPI